MRVHRKLAVLCAALVLTLMAGTGFGAGLGHRTAKTSHLQVADMTLPPSDPGFTPDSIVLVDAG
ncbi:MAG: hypothetical protein HYY08_04420 [Firmicutes bacterium]|nr:hypothetical protein [Bacillota bacterium]